VPRVAKQQNAHVANRVLGALSPAAYRRISRRLKNVELVLGEVLWERSAPLRHVYFPSEGMVSMIAVVDGGPGIEVGLIGREGVVGLPVAFGAKKAPVRALVQGQGSALRMTAAHFAAEMQKSAGLRREVDRLGYIAMTTAMQIAVCNKAHRLEARFARWLLMVRDRVASNEFQLTHHFLAQMLGVRRPGVTDAARALQRRHLIYYRRGRLSIVNPVGLREAACSCYAAIRTIEAESA
jgi:CRP-like cAMP-binding protein